MDIGDIIRELRTRNKLTQKDLAKEIGVTEQTIFRYEKGTRYPSFSALDKLEKFFGVRLGYNPDQKTQSETVLRVPSVDSLHIPAGSSYYDVLSRKDTLKHWVDRLDYKQLDKVEQLLNLAGMYVPHDPAAARAQVDAPAQLGKRRISVPILGRAAAGKPIEMIETSGDDLETDARLGDFVVIAVGNSMVEAGIQDGAQCLIRPQPTVENGEIALVAVGDGSTIKRFYKDDDGYRLVPCSPSHPVQHYDAGAPIRILGRFLKTID